MTVVWYHSTSEINVTQNHKHSLLDKFMILCWTWTDAYNTPNLIKGLGAYLGPSFVKLMELCAWISA